jgi:hypothetical protein
MQAAVEHKGLPLFASSQNQRIDFHAPFPDVECVFFMEHGGKNIRLLL